jgi:chromate reductase, NAD(P)H dehydrogenase (quinone)
VYVDVDTGRGFQKARVMSSYSVGYIVGSLSTESINRRLAKALIHLSPKHLKFVEIPIGDLPLYNRDFDTDYPPAGRALKDAIAAVDAVLFVTPEYNRGIPGCLKNAIDWASRPHGTNSFTRKPSAMIGASPGKIGTAVGQQSLRSALSFCDSPLMGAPEAYLQLTPGLITEVGEVTDNGTEQFLRDFMEAFEVFVARVLTVVTPERLGATG